MAGRHVACMRCSRNVARCSQRSATCPASNLPRRPRALVVDPWIRSDSRANATESALARLLARASACLRTPALAAEHKVVAVSDLASLTIREACKKPAPRTLSIAHCMLSPATFYMCSVPSWGRSCDDRLTRGSKDIGCA